VARKTNLNSKEIFKKTGIKSRYFITKNENASFIAYKAALQAIKRSKISKDEIDLVICCTFVGEYQYPCLASKVHKMLDLKDAGAYDINANCTGFQIGITSAAEKIQTDPKIKKVLVIGSAVQSPFLDWKKAENCMYFGDGAGAAIISKLPKGYGMISSATTCYSDAYEDVRLIGGGSSMHADKLNSKTKNFFYYDMNGLETWKHVVIHQPEVIKKALMSAKLKISEIDFFIFHQANKNLLEYLCSKLNISSKKTYTTVEFYGNTADASLAITLNDAIQKKKLQKETRY